MAASHRHGDPLTTCPTSLPPRPVGNPVMSRSWSKNCRFIHFSQLKSDYPRVTICSICLIKFFTSLWLPPFFSFCRFSLAGIACFSHSWRGPSSELPGHCRLSAHSPQHTGKNGAFPPLWSSSFFKCFHSILKETNQTNTNSMLVRILFYRTCTNIKSRDVGLHKYSSPL